MGYYLATTNISRIWHLDDKILLLGPWCITEPDNKKLLDDKGYILVDSPWQPAHKIKEAADYCYRVYEQLLPQLSESLNYIHRVSYPVKYWQVLVGPWLLHFIGVFYDRYKRLEKAIELFPNFYTHALPREQCKLASFDTHDSVVDCAGGREREDYYNLKLFSLVAYELCPLNIVGKDYKYKSEIHTIRDSWRRKLFNRLTKPLDLFFNGPIVLSNMYHLIYSDTFLLRCKIGFKTLRFKNFESLEEGSLKDNYSDKLRKEMKLKGVSDRFQSLLYRVLPKAIPICYMENYNYYKTSIVNIKNIDSVRIVGSAVGWWYKEGFKFFAAEAAANGATLIEFQHGGVYGTSFVASAEAISLEKDIFYTWGWRSKKDNKIKPLPNPHLSRLKDTYSPRFDNIIFVGTGMSKYHYRFDTLLLPEDMPKYFEDKKIFFQALPEKIRNKILYRPDTELGWNEMDTVKKICPNTKFVLKGKLTKWMKKAKLVVIDHPCSSFIEALTINVPCIFYWDHEVNLMRVEAEKYFRLLRDVGIVHKDPEGAAQKVKEIFNEPMKWWLNNDVQKARLEFCNRYAYARKDWLKVWAEELKRMQ